MTRLLTALLLFVVAGCPRPSCPTTPVPDPTLTMQVACSDVGAYYCERTVPACQTNNNCFPAFMAGCCGPASITARPCSALSRLTQHGADQCLTDLTAASCSSVLASLPASCEVNP